MAIKWNSPILPFIAYTHDNLCQKIRDYRISFFVVFIKIRHENSNNIALASPNF